jgi:chemotaxis protein MotB
MAKREKKPPEVKEGLPMWMGTFSDLVTLLMTFFVLMLSMANFEDTAKVETVIHSIQSALGASGFDADLVGSHVQQMYTTSPVRRDDTINPVVSKLRQAFEKHISDDLVRMVQNEQEIRVRLDDRVLFRPGSTELHPAAYALVTDLAEVLASEDVEIRVEGHTDASGTEEENWRISSERSLTVVTALRQRGDIPGERLEADAYGQFRPATGFGEAPAWNRRVELVLKSDHVGAVSAIERLSNP